jgi:hypothetical protein
MRFIRSERLRLAGLMIVIILAAFGHKCNDDDKDYVDQTQPTGQGFGEYRIDFASIPNSFDCESNPILSAWITPRIDPSYQGFNRVFFTLSGFGSVYRSNFIDFSSSNTDAQLVHFGGSLLSGNYSATAYMVNIQENCDNDSNIYARDDYILHSPSVAACNTTQISKSVEYGYQMSDTSAVQTYNLFQSPLLFENIEIAFGACDTHLDILDGTTGLNAELVSTNTEELMTYIRNKKLYTN